MRDNEKTFREVQELLIKARQKIERLEKENIELSKEIMKLNNTRLKLIEKNDELH